MKFLLPKTIYQILDPAKLDIGPVFIPAFLLLFNNPGPSVLLAQIDPEVVVALVGVELPLLVPFQILLWVGVVAKVGELRNGALLIGGTPGGKIN